jgi:hypothetical protein
MVETAKLISKNFEYDKPHAPQKVSWQAWCATILAVIVVSVVDIFMGGPFQAF